MKQTVFIVLFLLLPLGMKAQFSIGLRDSKYVGVSYTHKNSLGIGLEHSVFSQEVKTQYVRATMSYANLLNGFDYKAGIYYGTPYDGAYYNCGMMLSANYGISKAISLMATLNPHYDSYFEYKTCFDAGASFRLCTDISALLSYSTIPEFRQDEKRVKVGFNLTVQHLSVSPYLSIPAEGPVKSARLLVNINYVFKRR